MALQNVLDLLYDMCRLCLERVGRYNMFSNDFTTIIAECTGVQVVMGDELPQCICEVCMERLRMCKALRTLAMQSDARLRQLRDGSSRPLTESDTDCDFITPEIVMDSPEKPTTSDEGSSHVTKEGEQTNEEMSPKVPRIKVRVDIFDGQEDESATPKSTQINEKSAQQNDGSEYTVSQFTGGEAPTRPKRRRIDSEVSGSSQSEGDVSQYLKVVLEKDDSLDDAVLKADRSKGANISHFEEFNNVNPDSLEAEEIDVAAGVVVQVLEEDVNFYPTEDVALDIQNIPIVYLNEEGSAVSVEKPINVDAEGGNNGCVDHASGNHDSGDHNVIVEQVDQFDAEWSPNESLDVTTERAARGQGRSSLSLRDETAVRAQPARGRGRGRCSAARRDGEWRKGDILAEVYATDEGIPDDLRAQLQINNREPAALTRSGRGSSAVRGLGRGSAGKEDEDVANDERADEPSDDGGMIDDIMKEYKRFCRSDAAKFEWKSMESFQGAKEPFQVNGTGPTRIFQNAYDAFREYWDDAILQHIVDSTNAYGDAIPETERTFHKSWYHTNAHEILVFFAFWIMLGVIKMPSIKSCFSTNTLLKTDVFRTMFTEKRYWSLNRALRFALNETVEENPDKLRHIRPVLTHLNCKFKECYVPRQDICIDESLLLWKGNIFFRQYIKSKAAKYGIKSFELCEASSGYLWSFFIYTGVSSNKELLSIKTAEIVLSLILPLLEKGYRVFMDSYFNSPLLARFLKHKQTDCVGTLKRNRKHIPPLISKQILPPGSYIARHADDVVLLSQTDCKPLIMISTHHGTEQIQTKELPGRPPRYKFGAVMDYNIGMGGVDKKDQMLEPFMMERKQCQRWFKKCFKRLLSVTILNSRVLVEKSGVKTKTQLDFRLRLVEDILKRHMNLLPKHFRTPAAPSFAPSRIVCDDRRFHSIKRLDQTRTQQSGSACRQCRWCSERNHKRSRTAYECTVCKVPLCIEPCFALFHTKV